MAVLDLAQLTWEEVRDLDRAKAVAILPVGAVEAHGPHLPLATDVIIAETMARAAAARLATHGYDAVLLRRARARGAGRSRAGHADRCAPLRREPVAHAVLAPPPAPRAAARPRPARGRAAHDPRRGARAEPGDRRRDRPAARGDPRALAAGARAPAGRLGGRPGSHGGCGERSGGCER